MKKHSSSINTVDEIITHGVKKGILHLSTTDDKLRGNRITIDLKAGRKEVINFGSCSYLGLEFDSRLKQSACQAIEEYGTQFSTSRAYISSRYYEELESLLDKIFNAHTIVTPTTTLGHIAAIPVIVGKDDAVILDQQVHNSVHIAVSQIKTKGVHTELLRHNRMDMLEDRIRELRQRHKRIWYMADGVYSMFGDTSPVNEIYDLMALYPELHFYVDDAHGMSCFGEHGCGYVLSRQPLHERMVLAVSLAKAFASGGAVLVFPDKETARKVRTCGGPMITSGPLQPATLGASIASAKIHLSDEIYRLQEKLHKNIRFTSFLLKKYSLPLISQSVAPVFFVGLSLPKIGYSMVKKLIDEGYYLNLGIFPAVPIKNTGIRFTITGLHTFEQIENMVGTMACHLEETLKEEEVPLRSIYNAFRITNPLEQKLDEILDSAKNHSNLKTEHCQSISLVNGEEWDRLLGERGSFNREGLFFLENVFRNNAEPENNWEFDYIIIRDEGGNPVLATFLTTSLWKEDMLAPTGISKQLEERRKDDPYYLTSKVISTGSLFTAGNHLYINLKSTVWKEAMHLLLEKITELQEKYMVNTVVLRDLETGQEEMNDYLVENGHFMIGIPENHIFENPGWDTKEEFLKRLTKRSKRHVKQDVFRHEGKYEVEMAGRPDHADIGYWYRLYLNVKERSREINTFALPYKVFEQMAKDKNWEVITLKLKPEFDPRQHRKPVAVMFSYLTEQNYNFMIVGIDYNFQKKYKCYNQAIYQVLKRAGELGKQTVFLGYTAATEKKKFGAKQVISAGFMQTRDNYSLEVITSMNQPESAKELCS